MLLKLKAEVNMLRRKVKEMSKVRAERDGFQEKFRRAREALEVQKRKGELWEAKYRKTVDKMQKKKEKNPSQIELKRLRVSHERALGELRQTKAQVIALSKTEKQLRKSLHSATVKSKELARKTQILSLKQQGERRRSPMRTGKAVTPQRRTRRYSMASTSSTESSCSELDKSSRSIRSEPTKSLQAYDRYRKLKRVYQERYAA